MIVGKNTSGMYVIDEDYKIVSYNQAAREIYPQLRSGEKCYRCLRNRETPCEVCPIINGVKGPKNYLEPGQNILRSVDAVEIPLESEFGFHIRWNPAGQDMPLSFRIQRLMMRSAAE